MLKNLKIGKKLGVAFFIIIILTGYIGVSSFKFINNLEDSINTLYTRPFTLRGEILQAERDIIDLSSLMKDIAMSTDGPQLDAYIKIMKDLEKSIEGNFEVIYQLFDGEKEIVDTAYNTYEKWTPIREEIIKLSKAGKKSDATLVAQFRGASQVKLIKKNLEPLRTYSFNNAKELYENSNALASISEKNIIFTLIGIILISLIIALIITRSITKPIKTLQEKMFQGENGDLTVKFEINSKDEFGELGKSFNNMIENIRKLLNDTVEIIIKVDNSTDIISNSVDEIGHVSNEVSRTIQEVATGSSNQAKETQESFNVTNLLAQRVENIKQNSEKTNNSTNAMKKKSELGIQSITNLKGIFNKNINAVETASKGIKDLTIKSQSIGNIVETINSIAEQTNLLALNAAIEAAGAGDAGRGFAVVADEVRKLAEQSATATSEISRIIDEIREVILNTQDKMDYTVKVVNDANTSLVDTEAVFKEINKASDDVTDNIVMLDRYVKDIYEAKETVLKSIENISAISQESAASTQQVSASAEEQSASVEEVVATMTELNNMVKTLSDSIKVFKLN